MSVLGDDHDEMRTQPLLDDHTIESILAGRRFPDRPEVDELASFVSEVRSVADGPAPKLGADLTTILTGGLPRGKVDLPAAGLAKRRRSKIEAISASALGKAAAVLAGLGLATTGAAAADVLPEVAQDRVAVVVEAVSPFDLRHSADKGQDGKHRKGGGAGADIKPEVPFDHADPNAKDNLGADVSDRPQSTDAKDRDFERSLRETAPGQAPATRPTASNPGTERRQSAPGQAPAGSPTADSRSGTPHRQSAPGQPPASAPAPDGRPGAAHRR